MSKSRNSFKFNAYNRSTPQNESEKHLFQFIFEHFAQMCPSHTLTCYAAQLLLLLLLLVHFFFVLSISAGFLYGGTGIARKRTHMCSVCLCAYIYMFVCVNECERQSRSDSVCLCVLTSVPFLPLSSCICSMCVSARLI